MTNTKIHSNAFHQELKANVKKAIKTNLALKIASLSSASIGSIVMLFSTIGNSDFLPMANICFKPDESILSNPLDAKGENKRFCNNSDTIFPILKPYYDKLTQNNFDFATKTAIVNEHDNNIASTKLLLILASSFGLVGCVASGIGISVLRENKNAFYQLKHSEYSLNEQYAVASKEETSRKFGEYFKVSEPVQSPPSELEVLLASTSIEKEISENIAKTKEEEKKAAKLDKEINKIRGKLESGTDSNEDGIQDSTTADNELLKERADSLKEYLKQHDGGWLWLFIDGQRPFWLIGAMGSGKTWTLASIALVRKYCLGMQVGYVIDEHAVGKNSDMWDLLEPMKKLGVTEETQDADYQAISDAFLDMKSSYMRRIKDYKNAEKEPIQDIIDEYTDYKDNPVVGDSACKWYKSHLKDSRKAYRWTVAATHNDTNGSYPENTYNQRIAQTVLVEKKSKNGKTPLSNCVLVRGMFDDEGNQLYDIPVTFPTWFVPQKLHAHLTGGEEIEF